MQIILDGMLFSIEELSPQRGEILRSGNRRTVPVRNLSNSSLDLALKGQDCAEQPVQILRTASNTFL
ncbi:MAG: hypothetical protein K1X28_09400 [Parachlamydiales bacterium]|nr:hypothetical protein [Parachlamydiales bacterium]